MRICIKKMKNRITKQKKIEEKVNGIKKTGRQSQLVRMDKIDLTLLCRRSPRATTALTAQMLQNFIRNGLDTCIHFT